MLVRAIMGDNDIRGQMTRVVQLLESKAWREIWLSLNLSVRTFADLSLSTNASDAAVWHACPREQVVLITGNRNNEGDDSLQATIQAHSTPTSLPVMTLADADEVLRSWQYAHRNVESLLQYLLDIDKVRGAGRLWLP
jgi:hypothetical protein